eukprot:669520-Alexandrium_andersonii.AAC.1
MLGTLELRTALAGFGQRLMCVIFMFTLTIVQQAPQALAAVCSGLQQFAVVCGGLQRFAAVCS